MRKTKSLESFKITYPESHPGTDITQVSFHQENIDLVSLYEPGKPCDQRRLFVTDATVATLPDVSPFIAKFDDGKCGDDVLIILGSGEAYKTLESVLTMIQTAVDAGFSRKDLFVGIGGGVICDLTGFAASLFKRGAHVEFVPTTLLAMVDAAVGGKTGCDFDNYKNMIGCFFPAQKIHYYPQFVQSLSEEQYRSGLAEAFKTALLYDKELYDVFKTSKDPIINRDPDTLYNIIKRCAKAKAKVVEEDFTEKNVRMYLNLGHTFGHALETLAGLGNVTHGSAVAWGIGRILDICERKGICKEAYKDSVFQIMEQYGWNTASKPQCVTGGGLGDRFLNVMHKDKKNRADKIKLVLQRGLNDTFTEEVDDSEIIAVLK